MATLQELTDEFVAKLMEYTAQEMRSRVKSKINAAFGFDVEDFGSKHIPPGWQKAKTGSREMNDILDISKEDQPKKSMKRRKKQLCPVPRCKGLAAPVFGMVCSKHRDVAKSKIKAFRKQRAAKSKGK